MTSTNAAPNPPAADAIAGVSDASVLRRARVAVSIGFSMYGVAFAVWAVHIPIIAHRLDLDPAILGLALMNAGFGGLISQPLTGWLLSRTPSRPVAVVLLPVFLAAFCLPIVAWSTTVLFVATFVLGAAGGANNVAINTQASEIERARGRPTMSSFHGFFSGGALVGSFLGGGIIAAGWQNGSGAAVIAAAMFAVALFVVRFFLPTENAARSPTAGGRRRLALPSAAVLGLAVLVFFANSVEGAVADWSALYLSTVRGLSNAVAASGFAAFSFAMMVFRLLGGPVVAKFGERTIVVFGGVLIAIGIAIVVLVPWAPVSPLGFAFVALGSANLLPVMISAAARAPNTMPSTGVAATTTAALLGFLVGPPIIGFIAHVAGLSVAIGLLTVVGIVVTVGASIYRWPARQA